MNLPDKYTSLTIDKKVGQMFMIGLPGETLDESTYGLLQSMSPGGICLFARNTRKAKSTRMLIDAVRDAILFEPLIAVDQEGGLVDRLRRILEPMPSVRDVSLGGNAEAVRELAAITAEAIRILGFNLNFSPVIDVITPAREQLVNGLHSRAFGRSCEEVCALSTEYLDELQRGGILGCLKHFPGIGAAEADSHNELPLVPVSEQELEDIDLRPYREHLASGRAFAVMTGHAVFPHAEFQKDDSDGRPIPTSLNVNVVTGLLRDTLGFGGISLTDDLEMGAIIKNYGISEACVMAVEAGHDFLLICNSLESAEVGFRGVLEAVANGRISEDRLNASLERISAFRARLQPALDYDEARLAELSENVKTLKDSI